MDAAAGVVGELSTLDRFLVVWILIAMALGLGLGWVVPGLDDALSKVEVPTGQLSRRGSVTARRVP